MHFKFHTFQWNSIKKMVKNTRIQNTKNLHLGNWVLKNLPYQRLKKKGGTIYVIMSGYHQKNHPIYKYVCT